MLIIDVSVCPLLIENVFELEEAERGSYSKIESRGRERDTERESKRDIGRERGREL